MAFYKYRELLMALFGICRRKYNLVPLSFSLSVVVSDVIVFKKIILIRFLYF